MALYLKKKGEEKLLTTTKSIDIQNVTKAFSSGMETKLNEQNYVNIVIFSSTEVGDGTEAKGCSPACWPKRRASRGQKGQEARPT